MEMCRKEATTMKILLSLLVAGALAMAAIPASASDLAAMSTDELLQLRSSVNLELASRSPVTEGSIVWITPVAQVELISVTRGTADDGRLGVVLTMRYTNLNTETDHFRAAHWINVYQNGIEQDRPIRINGTLIDTDDWSRKLQPGASIQFQWYAYAPDDTETIDVELEHRKGLDLTATVYTIAMP